MALDTENMNIYKVETDNDIYNVVRNYDINKLFDKLIVPNATKEQLKDNLKKALNEKNMQGTSHPFKYQKLVRKTFFFSLLHF